MQISEELIRLCKKQKQSAQTELFGLLAPRLMGICYRYAGSRDDAEDLLQESFILIFTKIDSFREEGSFEGWARRITVNVAINWLKKHKKLSLELKEEIMNGQETGMEDDPDGFPMETEELVEIIGKMPDGYRTVLNLFGIEGFSHKEIAEKLGISESTSRSQFTRAKRILIQSVQTKIAAESYGKRSL